MIQSHQPYDIWRLPAFLLWLLLFLAGLVPDVIFLLLREWGRVVTQDALVNSDYLVTLALSGYCAAFTYQCCRAAGLDAVQSRARALQVAVLGLVAFMPFVAYAANYAAIPLASFRRPILIAGAGKALAWIYLLSIIFRYYFVNDFQAFLNMSVLLPSARARRAPGAPRKLPADTQGAIAGTLDPDESAGARAGVEHTSDPKL